MSKKTRISKVRVTIGSDGLGYYTAVYANGEDGPRSEGYGNVKLSRKHNLKEALEAAQDDFPGLPVEVIVKDEA